MSRHSVNTALHQLERIAELATLVTKAKLEELDRKARFAVVPDGFPTAVMGDGGSRSSGGPTSVESAADRRVFAGTEDTPRLPNDEIRKAIAAVFDHIRQMAHIVDQVGREIAYVEHVHAKAEGRQSSLSGACQCCAREVAGGQADPMRSGYCEACYRAWLREGRPEDRFMFEVQRRAWLADKEAS